MKPFVFQQFQVQQSNKVFRVGTDAVLLGVLANVDFAKTILEVGTGTGIVSLMLVQRNRQACISALDIDVNAFELAQSNFENSKFHERLTVCFQDFKLFQSEEKFDLIISNPPYFEVNDSSKDVLARQRIELDFEDLIRNAKRLLSKDGLFTVIIPSLDSDNFEKLCEDNALYLTRKIEIKGTQEGAIKRVVLEFSHLKIETKIESFIIEKAPRQYSDVYLELTKDFHVFKNKNL